MSVLLSKLNNAIGSSNEKKFLELIQDMTVLQFAVLERRKKLHTDWAYLIWRNSSSYGFNISWAGYSMLTSEELEQKIQDAIKNDSDDMGEEFWRDHYVVPSDFNPNIKFSELNIHALA